MSEAYSKEFCKWCGTYFSWEENTDPNDVESHYMAWNACKKEVLRIIENTPFTDIKEKIEKL